MSQAEYLYEKKYKTKMNKNIINILLSFSFIFIVVFSACDDTDTLNSIDGIIIPSSDVSYNKHIQPVFDLKYARAGCQDDISRSGGLSLTSHTNTTLDFLVVAPGLPQNSKLVWAIEGTGVNIMPPFGYPALTKNQIEGVKTWVKEGAKNN